MYRKTKQRIKFFLKLFFSLACLFFVFKKIDFTEAFLAISSTNIFYIILAIFFYNISQILSAYRINNFYKSSGFYLKPKSNIKLYYIGMFYNMFLPGAIGGDGFKLFMLKRNNPSIKTNILISATLLDRLSGLAVLSFILFIFLFFSSFRPDWLYYNTLILMTIMLVFPSYYLFIKLFFQFFLNKFSITTFLSFTVQGFQLICALIILLSLGISGHVIDYLSLFLLSSVAAVLPFTVGGVGARELVFLYGSSYLNINQPLAVSFALLFFIVTAVTAFAGFFFSHRINKLELTTLFSDRSNSK
jgi:uncharacterized membrane protein YbhN (UPF0104 family)